MQLFSRPKLPDTVRAELGLPRGERVLAWATLTGVPGYLVATDVALYRPSFHDEGYTRLGWDEIATASWGREDNTLRVVETARPDQAWTARLDDPGYLPETVRERVMSTIVVNQHVRLRDRQGVRITARRPASRQRLSVVDAPTPALRWDMRFDPELDVEGDPLLRVEADAALESLRRDVEG
jgi:hypothetical protein